MDKLIREVSVILPKLEAPLTVAHLMKMSEFTNVKEAIDGKHITGMCLMHHAFARKWVWIFTTRFGTYQCTVNADDYEIVERERSFKPVPVTKEQLMEVPLAFIHSGDDLDGDTINFTLAE